MSALFALPTDLLHLVFREWLLVKDLVEFDSACSRSMRCSFVSLTRDPVFIIPKVSLVEESNFIAFISWVHIRSAKLGALSIHPAHLKACAGITYSSLETVHSLEVRTKYSNGSLDMDHFSTFMMLMPSLTSLSMVGVDRVSDNAHLVFLTALPKLNLKHIELDHAATNPSEWVSSCAHLDPLIDRFGANLVTMHLGVRSISEETLKYTCTACTHVKSLQFGCERISTEALLMYLASDCLPALEVLHVFDMIYALDDATVISIAMHHSPLLRMDIDGNYQMREDGAGDGMTMFSCSAVLVACPAMRSLTTCAYTYESDAKGHSLEIRGMVLRKGGKSINLSAFPRPLQSVDVDSGGLCSESMVSFVSLFQASGKEMEDLRFTLADDIGDVEMCQIVACCGRLKFLHLLGVALSDSLLTAIADNCKHMEDLYLRNYGTNLTAAGWCYLFQSIGSSLNSLGLMGRDLWEEVLDTIPNTCPNLTHLSVSNSNNASFRYLVNGWLDSSRMPKLKSIVVDGTHWRGL